MNAVARQRFTGQFIAGLLLVIVSAALVANDGLCAWDALAAMCLLFGVARARRARTQWPGILPIGLACACTPLAAGVALIYGWRGLPRRERLIALAATGLIAVVVGLGARRIVEIPWTGALAVSNDVARLGPQNVWRVAAEWGDLVMPVLLMAMLAVCDQLFATNREKTANEWDHRIDRLASVWLGINVLAGICMPRVVVTHGLMFILPAFLLVPAGWRVLRTLPMTRSQWTLSLFTLSCWALILLLLWVPVRAAGEKILVALTLT